jgi:type I restriction-modification system DNA methylase subunit/restriction endonuclease S subunit
MKETRGEEITYFEDRDIEQAFIGHRRDMAKNEVKKIFRALKFYTNNDFAFKEVHNKKLFEQNTRVVREIVELLQGYQLKYSSNQAFLGNLFELLLNSGFKQSEGQFFTPIPIARFIVRCLPLRERMTTAHNTGQPNVIPRVIDYACGSAHFLTEIIEEIQEDLAALGLPEAENTTWTRDFIWGVEKDYRLARTAKIALFLHGAGNANILHEDGLDHVHPMLPKHGTVDILVANPPYSVKDFKQHLRLQNNQFTLLSHLTANSSEIEALFVERAAQLLAVGGLAGIILPSSILSNSGIYQRTRAMLLEKFLIRGIVELGGSAFIATGTNTIILLLERRPDTHLEHFSIRADALFHEEKKTNDADFADSDLLQSYCTAAGLDFTSYCQWLGDPAENPPDDLKKTALFIAYQREFNELAETKRRKQQATFSKLPQEEQKAVMRSKFLRHCRETERTKFLYFALAHVETLKQGEILRQHTTVLRCASDKATEQTFLGYKWSQRRGAEGMVALSNPYDGGLLFTPNANHRIEPPAKAAHYFRHAFLGTEPDELPDDSPIVDNLYITPTPAYLNFTGTTCDLAFNLSPAEFNDVLMFDTKYPLVSLGDVAEILSGGTPNTKVDRYWNGNIPWLSVADFRGKSRYVASAEKSITQDGLHESNTQVLNTGDIIISARGTVGEVAQLAVPMAFNQSCYGLRGKAGVDNGYLLFALRLLTDQMKARSSGATFKSITTRTLKTFQIPLPPLPMQKEIVKAIEDIEAAETEAHATVASAQQSIETAINQMFYSSHERKPLSEICELQRGRFSHRPRNDPRFFNGSYPFLQTADVVHARHGKVNYKQTLNEDGLAVSKLFKPPVVLITIAANIGDTAVLDYPACFTDSIVGLIPDNSMLPRFLEMMMRPHKEPLTEQAPNLAQKNINIEILRPLLVPVPPMNVQQKFVDEMTQYETQREQAEAELAAAPAKKRKILLDGIQ